MRVKAAGTEPKPIVYTPFKSNHAPSQGYDSKANQSVIKTVTKITAEGNSSATQRSLSGSSNLTLKKKSQQRQPAQ